MNLIILILTFLLLFMLSTSEAKAIVVIIPAVLIPIVQIVVWIVSAITTPIIFLSGLYAKNKKKSLVYGIFVGLLSIILISVLLIILFKIFNPSRPLY